MKRQIPLRRLALAGLLLGTPAITAIAQTTTPARAESVCEAQLEQADAGYREGRFEEVREHVASCLAAPPSRPEKARALTLRAKPEVADDDLAAARRTVGELLRASPEIEP